MERIQRPIEVTGLVQARQELSEVLRTFSTDGPGASPVIVGRHRRPEAALIPYDAYLQLLAAAGAGPQVALGAMPDAEGPRPMPNDAQARDLRDSDTNAAPTRRVRRMGMSQDEVRRSQILTTTARVISERGVDRTRLADISRAGAFSIELIQHHFESRDRVIEATFEYCIEQWTEAWRQEMSETTDPVERLGHLLQMAAFEAEGWHEIQWRIWIEFWSLCNRDPHFRSLYRAFYDSFKQPFRDCLADGVAAQRFRPTGSIDDVVDQLVAEIEGLRIQVLQEPARISRSRMYDLLVDIAGLLLETGDLAAHLLATRDLP